MQEISVFNSGFTATLVCFCIIMPGWGQRGGSIPLQSQKVIGSWLISIMDGLLNEPTRHRPAAPGPEPLHEVTVNTESIKQLQKDANN